MPHPRTKITPEIREDILRRIEAGETYASLAAAYGVTRQRVHMLYTKAKDPILGLKPTDISDLQFSKLVAELEKRSADRPKKGWPLDYVRKLAFELFQINLDMRHRRGDLRVAGVRLGDHAAQGHIPGLNDREFKKYLASPLAAEIREREIQWQTSEEERRKNYKPKLGRPRKKPLPEAPKPTDEANEDKDDDDIDFGIGSMEDIERSVAETRAQMAARGLSMPGEPPLTAWQRQQQKHGVRTGKHAGGNFQQKKKKRRR